MRHTEKKCLARRGRAPPVSRTNCSLLRREHVCAAFEARIADRAGRSWLHCSVQVGPHYDVQTHVRQELSFIKHTPTWFTCKHTLGHT